MSGVEEMRAATQTLAETMSTLSRSEYSAVVSAWRRFTAAAHADGALSRKHKELIAVAASILKGCERCISYHVHGALTAGATAQEIMEAAFVAVIMDGGPALARFSDVLDSLSAHQGDD